MGENKRRSNSKKKAQPKDDSETQRDYQQILLPYIDIPYFRNNPGYLDQWKELYETKKDPQILLLMNYKNIGTYHHWLYIKLAEHFVSINKVEIAHFVLEEAINRRVYDESKIRDLLKKLPEFTKRYSRGDMLALMNQRNIQALGRIWNRFTERCYYETHFEKDSPNFMLLEVMKMDGSDFLDGITVPGELIKKEDVNDPTIFLNYFGRPVLMDVKSINEGREITVLDAQLQLNEEIYFNGYVYLIRDVADSWFTAMKIAEDGADGHTVVGRNVCFSLIDEFSANLLIGRRSYEFCCLNGSYYVVFEFDNLTSLPTALSSSPSFVKYFYLKQVLHILQDFLDSGLILKNLDFFVSTSFTVHPFSLEVTELTDTSKNEMITALGSLFLGLTCDFTMNFDELIRLSMSELDGEDVRIAILKHKTTLLDTL